MVVLAERGHVGRLVAADEEVIQAVGKVVARVVVLALVQCADVVVEPQRVETQQPVIGDQAKLLMELENHDIDVLLTDVAPARDSGRAWIVNALAEQPVSLIGHPDRVTGKQSAKALLADQPIIVPSLESSIRIAFDSLCDRLAVRPTLRAEIDDMALMEALRANTFYVGALGSKNTSEARRKRLLQLDLSEDQINHLHAPVGLDIGSRTPPEIALSIMAGITAKRRLTLSA